MRRMPCHMQFNWSNENACASLGPKGLKLKKEKRSRDEFMQNRKAVSTETTSSGPNLALGKGGTMRR